MSDSPLSATELAEIAKRAEDATPGPWEATEDWVHGEQHFWQIEGPGIYYEGSKHRNQRGDAEFIAAARTDIPRLVADLRAARKTLKRLAEPGEAVVEAALTEYVGEPPFEDYFGEEGVGPHRINMASAIKAAVSVCQEKT
jgi:hypothetical protein